MAVRVTFADFDTVAYSVQHNLIQLINACVGLSVDVDITVNKVDGIQENLNNTSQEAHDAFLLATNLNERVSAVEFRTGEIWNNRLTFQSSPLGVRLKTIEDAIGL